MIAPTYDLQHSDPSSPDYLAAVQRLGQWVIDSGETLRPVVDAYTAFTTVNGRAAPRTFTEYLLEALLLGVLWRARGQEATVPNLARQQLISELVRERRSGSAKRRDASTAGLVSPRPSTHGTPTLHQVQQLLDWLLASGEYDEEYNRLRDWGTLFAISEPELGHQMLRLIAGFASCFEQAAELILGRFTQRVDHFTSRELAARPAREDTVQCSHRRVEYHLNMVGAELLNRVWRNAFLACRRHVLVMPGCARQRQDGSCKASATHLELRCSHCTTDCLISAATRLAKRHGAEACAVIHGSDFSSFLSSLALAGGDVGIIGVACAPGLMGAGWRARAKGLPAQCVLLNASGCEHWLARAEPTSFDLSELTRILDRSDGTMHMDSKTHVA